MRNFIHETASIEKCTIGFETKIWQFVVILAGAEIGNNCNVCAHVLIEGDVVIGNAVTIKSGVQLWNGLRVGNNVFIGPNVTFTNDKYPRSKIYPNSFLTTTIEDNASIGAGSVILPNVKIGKGSMVAAGSVVTKDVLPDSLVRGNPAKHIRFLDE